VPATLNWDLWLGVAPPRTYHPGYAPFKWRGWLDFGTGPIGDMGIHNAAMTWLGLRLGVPRSAKIVQSSSRNAETFPAWCILQLEFPDRGPRPPVTMYWYDGGKKPPGKLIQGRKLASNGAIAVGEKGTMYSVGWTGADWHLLPRETFRGYKPPEPTLRRVASHHKEWVAACKGGQPALCNFPDFAAPLTEVMLLGALAVRMGKPIQWNAAAMKAAGCPDADALVQRPYRKGWEI
jgi:predicted dehydrogenase